MFKHDYVVGISMPTNEGWWYDSFSSSWYDDNQNTLNIKTLQTNGISLITNCKVAY